MMMMQLLVAVVLLSMLLLLLVVEVVTVRLVGGDGIGAADVVHSFVCEDGILLLCILFSRYICADYI